MRRSQYISQSRIRANTRNSRPGGCANCLMGAGCRGQRGAPCRYRHQARVSSSARASTRSGVVNPSVYVL
jgi:hypothetical protein